jgi:DNA-binding MarR family transcriptional regulator
LDYLIVQRGFTEVLKLLQELIETVYIVNSILLVVVDPDTISPQELNLLKKEFARVETKQPLTLDNTLVEILEFVKDENNAGRAPAHKDVEKVFGITRPTAIKRLRVLKSKGFLAEKRRGRLKTLELSSKGREVI